MELDKSWSLWLNLHKNCNGTGEIIRFGWPWHIGRPYLTRKCRLLLQLWNDIITTALKWVLLQLCNNIVTTALKWHLIENIVTTALKWYCYYSFEMTLLLQLWNECYYSFVITLLLQLWNDIWLKILLQQLWNWYCYYSFEMALLLQLWNDIVTTALKWHLIENIVTTALKWYCYYSFEMILGAQWLIGRVLDSRPRGRWFEPHGVTVLCPGLVLVQPRKTRPVITENLLTVT